MDSDRIKLFNYIIETHNQFKDDSKLWPAVRDVWNVSDRKAKKLSKEYCNVISFWAVLTSSGLITDSLRAFMIYCKTTKYIKKNGKPHLYKKLLDKDGYIRGKDQILKAYGINLNWIYFDNYNCLEKGALDDNYFYHMKMSPKGRRGYHFMGGYVKDDILHLSCSSYRGIDFVAKDKVEKKEFYWILQIG